MYKSSPPPPRPASLHWQYRQIPPGSSLRGWLAGRLVGALVHWDSRSRPCRRHLTSGALACPHCEAEMGTRWLGYVPLIDRSGKQLAITCSQTLALTFNEIAIATDLEVGRGAGKRDPLWVKLLVGYEAARPPALVRRLAPDGLDLRDWLLVLWDDPVLLEFFRTSSAHSSTK